MRTIAVVNQKGGCGKTITTINLAAFLARADRRVLVVDMDPQGHATLGLLPRSVALSGTMYEVLIEPAGERTARLRAITRAVRDNLDLAPADIVLSAIPEKLAGVPGRENILAEALRGVSDQYDYVLIDCPPSVGVLTFNALKASAEAIVPMDPSFFSLHGIGKLLETFDVLERDAGHHIAARVLVTMFSGRSPFVRAVVDEMHTHLRDRHFNTVIRHSIKLAESASHGLPIAHYCRCAGFEDYQALSDEVLLQEPELHEDVLHEDVLHEDVSHEDVSHEEVIHPDAIHEDVAHDQPEWTLASPAISADTVTFAIEAPEAAHVQVAGDFNGWRLDAGEMEPTGRVWKKVLKLSPGRYRYRYVVDGRWLTDPLNAAVEPCPFGGENSVLVLGGQAGK